MARRHPRVRGATPPRCSRPRTTISGADARPHLAQYGRTHTVDGAPVPYMHGLQWPGIVSVADLPATAVPTGRLVDGLPTGLQFVGPFGEDRTPLRFAALAERATGGYAAPPLA